MNATIPQDGGTLHPSSPNTQKPFYDFHPLRFFLQAALTLTGAEAGSLWLRDPIRNPIHTSILQEGDPPFLPQFDNPQLLERWIAELGPKNEPRDHGVFKPNSNNAGMDLNESGLILKLLPEILRIQTSYLSQPRQRRHSDHKSAIASPEFWLGLRFANDLQCFKAFEALNSRSSSSNLWPSLPIAAQMAFENHKLATLMRDPVCQLPGRVEFHACLSSCLQKESARQGQLGLILINPDEFGVINQRYGQEQGDSTLRAIAAKILSGLRQSDLVFRYGGAIFAVILEASDAQRTQKVGEKLLNLLSGPYLEGKIQLSFSIGIHSFDGRTDNGETDINDFLQKADHALNVAKLSGGGRVVLWQPGEFDSIQSYDRLSGIFTADSERDYRNMLLLWDTISTISANEDMQGIASEFIERVAAVFQFSRAALFTHDDQEAPAVIAGVYGKDSHGKPNSAHSFPLSGKQKELLKITRQRKKIERIKWGKKNQSHVAYAFPLTARDVFLGWVYLEGVDDVLQLDSSDLVFLDALAKQVAIAIDRARLAADWKSEKQRESQQLKQEVEALRQALPQARLVYRSPQLQSVLETIKTVAPTDVTVLITGESGTGKEVMARTLHEHSLRQDNPFITVDCGAIAPTLLEAELFGHVKGAYTGADSASEGRIMQANGGTLFLDEIGELPLDVQAKLLRFVQEKEITPVGGGKTRNVDVRIVAATNRNLFQEVAKGRFRQDLYYRLQVVTVTVPPLRERPDDILPLARFFVEKFALQYGKAKLRLAPDTESLLLAHSWPGNVRELHNTLLRAVVMAQSEIIAPTDLQLVDDSKHTSPPAIPEKEVFIPSSIAAAETRQPAFDNLSKQNTHLSPAHEDPWEALRRALSDQLTAVLSSEHGAPVPLGRWLVEDLVIEADKQHRHIARRACKALGMAETTFRRHLEKVNRETSLGLVTRTTHWRKIQPCLESLVRTASLSDTPKIAENARRMLLHIIAEQVADNTQLGAKLMGVSVPTYRKSIKTLNAAHEI
ncbi:MAG: hypothetical protein AXA67_01635 [Methylothermaceae bacteria B42]|nr:MAG: hypothetical protein AXA67_01635 [Methylothermaceae bacteria B42]HHJ38026.1 diguanylate cyclase [Methylothermaceae bacterium]